MNLIVCEKCEAEFKIKHSMNDHNYRIMHCPFCDGDIDDPDYIDEIEWEEDSEC